MRVVIKSWAHQVSDPQDGEDTQNYINRLIQREEETGRVVSVVPDFGRCRVTLCIVDRLEDRLDEIQSAKKAEREVADE